MVIKINDCYGEVEIEEFIDPTNTSYEIRQGENKIQFQTDYLINELSKAIQFILRRRNNLYECQSKN